MKNQEIKIGDNIILRRVTKYYVENLSGVITGISEKKYRVKTTNQGNRWYSKSRVYLR